MNYAYARVSAKDQNLQRQIAAFSEFGIEKSRIFSEKKSGKDFERKEYKRLLKKLNCGDLLVIKSIDRLGRNYSQIIEEWNRITNVIGADILVLDMPLLDCPTGLPRCLLLDAPKRLPDTFRLMPLPPNSHGGGNAR